MGQTFKGKHMKQYNRIMLGEHGKYFKHCFEHHFIGVSFLPDTDLKATPCTQEGIWRQKMIEEYLNKHADKSMQTARNSIGFLWTVCFGLKIGDIILTPNGNGSYQVGEIKSDYTYHPNEILPHRREIEWKDIIIPRKSMSKSLQNSTGSIGTCCNITKYAKEIDALLNGTISSVREQRTISSSELDFKERSLHRLLSNYLSQRNILSKTIYHESSNRADQAQKWVHPDMIGVEFNEFQESSTRLLLKATEAKEYINLYSYELKRTINNDHELKEYFFQALSNSNWANYGYLVAFEINEDIMEEIERLNRAFGIGVIKLSPYKEDTTILFAAQKKELDYYTIDKLCRINQDFNLFIDKTTKVIKAQTNYLEEVMDGLRKFCEKGFNSNEELLEYCKKQNIPC